MGKAREKFEAVFSRILTGSPGLVVVHSSLPNLLPETGAEEELFAVVEEYIDAGWTWFFPSFTFSFCAGKPFNLNKSRSEVGIVADLARLRLTNAVRSRHPVYSFVAAGSRAGELLEYPSSVCFGDDSPFALFEKEDARQIMLGCGYEYFTQAHRYEEKAGVPYRIHRNFSGLADWGEGKGLESCEVDLFVRDWRLGANHSWRRVVERLRDAGVFFEAKLWRGEVLAAKTRDIRQAATDLLNQDRLALVVNKEHVAAKMRARNLVGDDAGLKIALLGSSNTHLMRRALETELSSMLTNRNWSIYTSSYGQLLRDMTVVDSELSHVQPDISIFCNRLEDLAGGIALDISRPDKILATVRQYAQSLANWAERNGNWMIVHRFAPLDYAAALESGSLFNQANAILDQALADKKRLIWLEPAALAAAAGEMAVDNRLWLLGRYGFSERMSMLVARHWAGYVVGITGNSARVIVTDLDNTLWGGVLGEDGQSGLEIGGDYPGNAFSQFQETLKLLRERGIILAVCSKNDPDPALAAMDELPGMRVRTGDLGAYRIGWRPKYEYLREMAEELNLGLSSFLFVDDNPVERDLIRKYLPDVKILDLPADPAEYASALIRCPWLAHLPATKEDRLRAANVAGRKQVEMERQQAVKLEDFYAGLGLKMHLNPVDKNNVARAEQLCQKTNQFNTTGKRYSARDLEALAENGADVVVIGLEDKYTALENIGVLILKPETETAGSVDLYLLSCRILGRGIEIPVIRWAVSRAAERGWGELFGQVVESARNLPVREIFSEAGMEKISEGKWRMRIGETDCAHPQWLQLQDNVAIKAQNRARKSVRVSRRRQVAEIFARVLGLSMDKLEDAAMDKTPGWDSIHHIELILALEKEFGATIPSDQIMELKTFAKAATAFSNIEE